jgi:hypothetical protein
MTYDEAVAKGLPTVDGLVRAEAARALGLPLARVLVLALEGRRPPPPIDLAIGDPLLSQMADDDARGTVASGMEGASGGAESLGSTLEAVGRSGLAASSSSLVLSSTSGVSPVNATTTAAPVPASGSTTSLARPASAATAPVTTALPPAVRPALASPMLPVQVVATLALLPAPSGGGCADALAAAEELVASFTRIPLRAFPPGSDVAADASFLPTVLLGRCPPPRVTPHPTHCPVLTCRGRGACWLGSDNGAGVPVSGGQPYADGAGGRRRGVGTACGADGTVGAGFTDVGTVGRCGRCSYRGAVRAAARPSSRTDWR